MEIIYGRKKPTISKEVEKTMACSAFAEAGEPCPIDIDKKEDSPTKETRISIEGTMACSAFAEAGESCPIKTDKKKE